MSYIVGVRCLVAGGIDEVGQTQAGPGQSAELHVQQIGLCALTKHWTAFPDRFFLPGFPESWQRFSVRGMNAGGLLYLVTQVSTIGIANVSADSPCS